MWLAKNYQTFYEIKTFKHLYKMYLISAERYNGGVPILIINNKKKLAKFGFGVKNMSDRVLKEILRHLWNKKPYERAN